MSVGRPLRRALYCRHCCQSGGAPSPDTNAAQPEVFAEATDLLTPKRVDCWGCFFVARQGWLISLDCCRGVRAAVRDLLYSKGSTAASRTARYGMV